MSSITVTSNISAIESSLRSQINRLQAEYAISIENHVSYAAAVDQGSTRIIEWAKVSKAQKAAIAISMRERGTAPRWGGKKGFKVTKGEGWVKIVIPPEGMLAKSVGPIRAHARDVLRHLPSGFDGGDIDRELRVDIAQGAVSILVDNTPVDQGALRLGWGVRT